MQHEAQPMIPRIVHYIWVGPKPLPEPDRRRVEEWRTMMPDWEFRFWSNETVDFSSRYLWQAYSVRAWNRVSDYTRMDALSKFGGVYLDTDIDLLRPLDPLRGDSAFLGFQAGDERPGELVNGAVFGAAPGHWLPVSIRRIFDEEFDGRTDIGSFAGPGLITRVLRGHGLERYSDQPVKVRDVTLYPKRYFYPYSWTETYSPDVISPDTYAVHRWAETWVVKQPTFRTRARRAFINRLARYVPSLALLASQMAVRRGSRRSARSL